MNWSHLPVAGGIYDQHPELLKEWEVIWKAKYEARKKKERAEKSNNPKVPGLPKGANLGSRARRR